MLTHAISYLGSDAIAVGILQNALRKTYSEHYQRFTGRRGIGGGLQQGRMVGHWCGDCKKYNRARLASA